MNDTICNRPGLLVSVRNPIEAVAALAGGADVIDVKEPDRGSLGAADPTTIAAVVRSVGGRAPVTAATGELLELGSAGEFRIPAGVSLFKIGLAGCRDLADWKSRWQEAIATLAGRNASQPVGVAYADWLAADSPEPDAVLAAAVELGCPALLIDTWDKSDGSLFDHWRPSSLATFVRTAQTFNLTVVLAGSLVGESVAAAARLRPDLIAVRTAACVAGRRSSVSCEKVHALRQTVRASTFTLPAASSSQ
jgi:uncharacterized protein (UPF0264 family)